MLWAAFSKSPWKKVILLKTFFFKRCSQMANNPHNISAYSSAFFLAMPWVATRPIDLLHSPKRCISIRPNDICNYTYVHKVTRFSVSCPAPCKMQSMKKKNSTLESRNNLLCKGKMRSPKSVHRNMIVPVNRSYTPFTCLIGMSQKWESPKCLVDTGKHFCILRHGDEYMR